MWPVGEADIVEDIDRQHLVLAGQRIDRNLGDGRAIGEIVERSPLVRRAVIGDPRRGVEASFLPFLLATSFSRFPISFEKAVGYVGGIRTSGSI